MTNTGETFPHPEAPEASHLREHYIYTITRERWARNVAWQSV